MFLNTVRLFRIRYMQALFLFFIGLGLSACPATLIPPAIDITLNATEYAPGSKIKVTVVVTNFSLSQDFLGKENKPGQGHYRIYLDDRSANEQIAESGAGSVEFELPKDITAGNHVLKVVLFNNDKTQLNPESKETKTFVVKEKGGPSIRIKSNKQTVGIGDTLSLTIELTNFTLTPISAEPVNKRGEGHYHLVWDDNEPEKDYQTTATKKKLDINISDTLAPGKHILWAYLMNNNHTLYKTDDGAVVKASIELNITGGTKPRLEVTITPKEVEPDGIISVSIKASNFKLIDPKSGAPNAFGEGHFRITLDDKNPSKDFLIKDIRSRVEVSLKGIAPGTHNIVVHLVNNDGSQLDEPVKASSPIFIKGGAKPELKVTIDKNEGLPGDPFQLDISVKNFKFKAIANGATNKPGEGHYHIVFDNRDPEVGYTWPSNSLQPKLKIPKDLFPGKHKLWVYLMNNDHSLYVPETKFSVELTVLTGKEPAVSITLDKSSIKVGGDIIATVKVKNFVLKTPGGANKKGEGHFHIVLGTQDPEQYYLAATHTSPTKITMRSSITPGKYKIMVYLMNNDHTITDPKVFSFTTLEITK